MVTGSDLQTFVRHPLNEESGKEPRTTLANVAAHRSDIKRVAEIYRRKWTAKG